MDRDPTLAGLLARIQSRVATPEQELAAVRQRIAGWNDPALFLHLPATFDAPGTGLLSGVGVAVKDNIDVRGMPTTAGCPSFASMPGGDSAVVAALRAAGAVPVGKTNLDQFATGLVGTRSPAGVPRNPLLAERIPGGSSSGSACAVAAGLVPIALGTDTAGSGRVPAAFTNCVGLKPTKGLVSTRGVVPAVRSLDCVSVFALTVHDAWQVLQLVAGFDAQDIFSRPRPPTSRPVSRLRVGIAHPSALGADLDPLFLEGYRTAQATLHSLGHELVEVDIAPFLAAARLLYEGPWVAERTAAVGAFLDTQPADADPVVAAIIRAGAQHTAIAAYRGIYELARLRRLSDAIFATIDILMLPTTPGHPSLAEVRADPVGVNARMGRYTNFVNLLDTCALAVPAALSAASRPSGITLFAPAWQDTLLCRVGAQMQKILDLPLGATGMRVAHRLDIDGDDDGIIVAVFGAHLRGQPLNRQLLTLRGEYVGDCTTAAVYRCHLLEGAQRRPGLVRCASGTAIAGELWKLPAAGFGSLVASVAPPLAIGTVELSDGRRVKGFVCEEFPTIGTRDISSFGDWRKFLA